MKKVVLARIDDRLIHGQVITAWLKYVKADSILIIDEDLKRNEIMQRIYKAAAPTDIDLYVEDFDGAVKFLEDEDPNNKEVIILVKIPEMLEGLMEEGVDIKTIILGGMGSNQYRKQLVKNVFASSEERTCFARIIQRGVTVLYQLVPDDKAMNIESLVV